MTFHNLGALIAGNFLYIYTRIVRRYGIPYYLYYLHYYLILVRIHYTYILHTKVKILLDFAIFTFSQYE